MSFHRTALILKVKCAWEQAMNTKRVSRNIALLFLQLRRCISGGRGCQRHVPVSIPTKNQPKPIIQEAGWAPGPVRPGAEDLPPPNGIRSQDLPARSESLNRLSCPDPQHLFIFDLIFGYKNEGIKTGLGRMFWRKQLHMLVLDL